MIYLCFTPIYILKLYLPTGFCLWLAETRKNRNWQFPFLISWKFNFCPFRLAEFPFFFAFQLTKGYASCVNIFHTFHVPSARSYRESNPELQLRRLLLYPFNYRNISPIFGLKSRFFAIGPVTDYSIFLWFSSGTHFTDSVKLTPQ